VIGLKKIAGSLVVMAGALVPAAHFAAAQSAATPDAQPASVSKPSLDYEFFKTRVEPIFLKKRPGHARCYVCHSPGAEGGAPTYLEQLLPGNTSWTEEQSRRIFQRVSGLVVPGDPAASRLLMHPLAPEEGGITLPVLHRGGRQFASKNDPDWQTLAEWVRGGKPESASRQ
jgi:hypothetical protein